LGVKQRSGQNVVGRRERGKINQLEETIMADLWFTEGNGTKEMSRR
jgi:hypothetical protein